MTPEQQQIAIERVCGWERKSGIMTYDGVQMPWTIWVKDGKKYNNAPDFLNDLNAMHSAINQQSVDFQEKFDTALRSLNGLIHQTTSTRWAEIFIDIALRKDIIK